MATKKEKYPELTDLKTPEPIVEKENQKESESLDFNEKIVNQVFDDTNIKVKSELTSKQIMPIARMYVFSNEFKSEAAAFIADTYLTLTISKDRKGREEFKDIAKAAMSAMVEPPMELEENTGAARFILGKK